jgi:hypothetical protein
MFPHHFNNSIQYETSADASSSSFVAKSLSVATVPLDEDIESRFNRWFGNGETSSIINVHTTREQTEFPNITNAEPYSRHSRQPGVTRIQLPGYGRRHLYRRPFHLRTILDYWVFRRPNHRYITRAAIWLAHFVSMVDTAES